MGLTDAAVGFSRPLGFTWIAEAGPFRDSVELSFVQERIPANRQSHPERIFAGLVGFSEAGSPDKGERLGPLGFRPHFFWSTAAPRRLIVADRDDCAVRMLGVKRALSGLRRSERRAPTSLGAERHRTSRGQSGPTSSFPREPGDCEGW